MIIRAARGPAWSLRWSCGLTDGRAEVHVDGELMQLQGRWRQVTCDADGVLNVTDEYGPVVATFIGTR